MTLFFMKFLSGLAWNERDGSEGNGGGISCELYDHEACFEFLLKF